MNKNLLRKKYKPQYSIDEKIDAAILKQVENYILTNNASVIGLYLPMIGEIDLTPLIVKYPEMKFAAPKIQNDNIFFVRYFASSPLEKNKDYSNYLQPKSEEELIPDLLFIPAIAFDVRGYRLGRGKGHYDKYLAKNNIIKVGLIENKRLLEYIPNEDHDQKMDVIISEEIVINLCK